MDEQQLILVRLECLKLAAAAEGRSGWAAPAKVTAYADDLFAWVLAATPQTVQTQSKGKAK